MFDERYLIHRLKSTSVAGMVGGVLMGIWILYQYFKEAVFRWDLMSILLIMGVVKLSLLLYYRKTN
jgi:hypothetical protein